MGDDEDAEAWVTVDRTTLEKLDAIFDMQTREIVRTAKVLGVAVEYGLRQWRAELFRGQADDKECVAIAELGQHAIDDAIAMAIDDAARDEAKGRDGGTWDDPDWSILVDRRGELPDFPINVLSPEWRAWLERAAHGAGVTNDHVAVPLLGIASSLIGTARKIQASRSWSQPCTDWVAVVGLAPVRRQDSTRKSSFEIRLP